MTIDIYIRNWHFLNENTIHSMYICIYIVEIYIINHRINENISKDQPLSNHLVPITVKYIDIYLYFHFTWIDKVMNPILDYFLNNNI
jgi:hypothetical protein